MARRDRGCRHMLLITKLNVDKDPGDSVGVKLGLPAWKQPWQRGRGLVSEHAWGGGNEENQSVSCSSHSTHLGGIGLPFDYPPSLSLSLCPYFSKFSYNAMIQMGDLALQAYLEANSLWVAD